MRAVTVAVVLALTVSGCGLMPRVPVTTTRSTPAVTSNEVSTPLGPVEHAIGSPTAVVAVHAFVSTYINWDATDVRGRLSGLARASVGQARSAMTLEAAQTGADPELAQAGVANHGTVEAVAPVAGRPDRYVAVTLESTTANDSSAYDGLAPAWHLALVSVTRRAQGWVVSGFEPEN